MNNSDLAKYKYPGYDGEIKPCSESLEITEHSCKDCLKYPRYITRRTILRLVYVDSFAEITQFYIVALVQQNVSIKPRCIYLARQ